MSESATYGLGSLVWRARRPFHPQRVAEFLASAPMKRVERMKGFAWIATRPRMRCILQPVGRRARLDPARPWWAFVAEGQWPADPASRSAIERTWVRRWGICGRNWRSSASLSSAASNERCSATRNSRCAKRAGSSSPTRCRRGRSQRTWALQRSRVDAATGPSAARAETGRARRPLSSRRPQGRRARACARGPSSTRPPRSKRVVRRASPRWTA